MRSICLCFQIHHPYQLRTYRFFDIGKDHYYYDDFQNRYIIRRLAEKAYIPANKTLLNLIKEHGKNFKISFSISGSAIEQLQTHAPEVIDGFKELAQTGSVEFLGGTYNNSLASLNNTNEFALQVELHKNKLNELFGVSPKIFSNTDLLYNDEIGLKVSELGFEGQIIEGAKHVLGWKSPNYVYANALNKNFKLLLRNFRMSDDISFRFSNTQWDAYPLTTDKFVDWLNTGQPDEHCVNLFMNYDVLGERQQAETGIFDFIQYLPKAVFEKSDFLFKTLSEATQQTTPAAPLYAPHTISWLDEERDLSAWQGNDLQKEAFRMLYSMENKIQNCNDTQIIEDFKRLQASDHFYFMNTKWFLTGKPCLYYNAYASPYDAFINYMNVLTDLNMRLDKEKITL